MTIKTQAKQCPKCGKRAETVDECELLFGMRNYKDSVFWQSQCKACRTKVLAKVSTSRQIVLDRVTTQTQYLSEFPRDTNALKRSWKFMTDKLIKRGYNYSAECNAQRGVISGSKTKAKKAKVKE